ncbi:hypothetical protein RND71_010304 [Anisodus tanguticus]|uniref:Uncharacterized protein n=1 Tax=Anisodus tanguticus TaxID=243964 RepID=A0AAE1SHI2_9SOLA|nr:hypothetical protein RND71_010304 [Anisodus tanguticus]
MRNMQASPMVSLSSSFTRDSNTNLAEIAARVVEEFRAENETDTGSNQFSPISADEIFDNGQIRPIFNRALLLNGVEFKDETCCNLDKVSTPPKSIRVPLKKLFIVRSRRLRSYSSGNILCVEAESGGRISIIEYFYDILYLIIFIL